MNATAETTTAYPKCLQDQLDRIERERMRALEYLEPSKLIEQVVEEFSGKWESHNSYTKNISASVGSGPHELNGALLMIYTKDFAVVYPVLRRLRAAGHKIVGHDDYVELNRRTYNLGNIKVCVFLPSEGEAEGARCKFVQTGTKEVPVYTLKCDEEAPADFKPDAPSPN